MAKVEPGQEGFLAGGSILAALDTFKKMWVSMMNWAQDHRTEDFLASGAFWVSFSECGLTSA